MKLEGYRKFGLAGFIAGVAVYEKAWWVALVAYGIYAVTNTAGKFVPSDSVPSDSAPTYEEE